MSLISRSYESPLPKGAPYLGDPAQIVEPQNEFVIRKDAGADIEGCLAEFGMCKRDKSLLFLHFAIMKLTKKKIQDGFPYQRASFSFESCGLTNWDDR